MASTYDIGDRVRVTGTFTDTGGDEVDPTSVYFRYDRPAVGSSYTTAVYASSSTGLGYIDHPSTGVYTFDIVTTGAGIYSYKMWSTGVATSAAQGYFKVRSDYGST